jgi:hypothetical protein
MIVGDFHLLRTLVRPAETEAVLLIDANAVLAASIAFQRFKTVSGRTFQVLKAGRGMEDQELCPSPSAKIGRKSASRETMEEFFGFST